MYDRFSLQCLLAIVIVFVCAVPVMADVEGVDDIQDVEGTIRGAMRMTLLDAATTLTDNPTNDIHVSLGDTISIDVWLQNPTQEEITSVSTYFTVDGAYFEPVTLATYSNGELQVFEDGYFMSPAQPETIYPIGNYTHSDIDGPDDNGIPGWQLDYFVYGAPPAIGGGEQKYSNYPEGVACTFKLVAKAVCDSIGITLDYTPGNQRFSRYGIRGSNDTFTFRGFQTCYITVSGLKIEPPLPDLFMEPDSVDSTSLDLDKHVNSGAIPDSLFKWTASGNTNIGVSINPSTHQVTFTAPAGFRGYEDITFTLSNNSDPNLDSDTMRVTVGYQPRLLKTAIPDTITIYEDSTHVAVLYLPDIVEDIDNDFSTLIWQFTTKGGNVIPEKQNAVLSLHGVENFFGNDSLYIKVTDDMQLSDRDTVLVRVLPVNDAPVIAGLPDAEFERTESYQFDLSQYAYDVDNDPLQVTWGSPEHFFVNSVGMDITITEVEGYIGSEDIVFTVRDPSGLADSDTMQVTVTPKSLAPVWQQIPKLGFAQDGMFSDLVLWDYVNDPDGQDYELTFTFTGYDDVDSIYVDPANGRLYMWDLDDSPGWDWVRVTARDYDDNTASTRFLVFVAPKDGTPIVGAIPDTTMRAGRLLEWIDLDDYYYDIDNTDGQMKWTWEHLDPDTLVYAEIHNLFRTVTLNTYNPDSTGFDDLRFRVTDPDNKTASDDCTITVLGETKPLLDMPAKIGFVTGKRVVIDLDNYTEDPDFPKSDLTWKWWGNTNIEMGYDTSDTTLSRPFYFNSNGTWIGWEKTFFMVSNPLGGASTDSTIVFSVPADGTPVAGGLEYVYVRAGYCDSMSIDLDNYYYDIDTLDWGVSWSVAGNDSVLVSIDPVTHRAQFCSPSETFEGQEIITLTVSDGIHTDSMDVAVIVYGAVYRNVFTLNVFRNPMQSDYMDFYLECSKELYNVPAVEVRVENSAGGDTTNVTMSVVRDDAMFYHGLYLLPYESSLGIERTAEVIATAQTKNGKAVEDTLAFTYGRLGASGGKLALGPVSLKVPADAIEVPVTITIVPGSDEDNETESSAKTSSEELLFAGSSYVIGPSKLVSIVPMTVSFERCCRTDGIGIYRLVSGVWEYLPGTVSDGEVSAGTLVAGTYRLAYDRIPPEVKLKSAGQGTVTFTVTDGGSGIDPTAVTAAWNGNTLSVSYDSENGLFNAALPDFYEEADVRITVNVSDRSGNTQTTELDTRLSPKPGQFSVMQNMPNPFNPRTSIPFVTTSEQHVKIVVYDVLGRRICVLADNIFTAGAHSIVWDAHDDAGRPVSSGVYVYRVESGNTVVTRKMVLMR